MPSMNEASRTLRLPDFVGIGAQKAGTTYLWQQLADHPEIATPNEKELRFFFKEVPIDSYAAEFQSVPDHLRCGEITPAYLFFPEVAQRIDATLPRARLFVILRDPAERAFSQWLMLRDLDRVPAGLSFIEAFHQGLPTRAPMADRGFYAEQLHRFEASYNDGRLLVLWYEDLVENPGLVISSLYSHVGVDPHHQSARLHDRAAARAEDAPRLSNGERDQLVAFYGSSIQELARMTGRDLTGWLD